MKSKKIVAMIVAFAAFMAVATSGLAATTTYNYTTDGYVDVKVEAYADKGSEVTYLVETGSGEDKEIVYIDQQTANAETGKVVFNYKIAAAKIADFEADVKYGTDGINSVTSGGTLEFADANVTGNNITVTYWEDENCTSDAIDGTAKLGTGDVVYAKIEPAANYKLVSYTKNGGEAQQFTSNIIPVVYNDEIVVTTEKVVKEPVVNVVGEVTSSAEIIDAAEKVEVSEDNKGNKLDYENVINKFVVAQDVPADKKIVLTCANPNDPTQTLEFPVVADSFDGNLSGVKYYLVRFVQNGSDIDLSSAVFSFNLE